MIINALIYARFNSTITYCKKIYILVGICVSQSNRFITECCTVVTDFCTLVKDLCTPVWDLIALKLTNHSGVSFLYIPLFNLISTIAVDMDKFSS